MRLAVTGGTGFVGGHFARDLARAGHDVVIVSRGVDGRPWATEVTRTKGVSAHHVGLSDVAGLTRAFAGCEAVAHCAGINREIGGQTYQAVHVAGTANVIRAAQDAGVARMTFTSFLRARPDCGSAYHESKWRAEELVRSSDLDWTVLKPGMIYGRGDHMLDHLSHALYTFPIFLGARGFRVRPVAIGDLVAVMSASLVDGRLSRQTIGLVGPTEIEFNDAARMVATVIGRRRIVVSSPFITLRGVAVVAERAMDVPLISRAQVRILEEGVVEATLAPDIVPPDLCPSTPFDASSIDAGLPDPGPFRWSDLRGSARRAPASSAGSVLIFDGDCAFCTTVARWAERGLGHGERVTAWQLMDRDELAAHALSADDVREAAWWVDDAGGRDRGHRAIGRALRARGGPWMLAGWAVLLPPTSWIAAGVYSLVARWRHRLPGGTPACQMPRAPSRG